MKIKKVTLLVVWMLLLTFSAYAHTYNGVFVGISDYIGTANDLPDDCEWDAEEMRDLLYDDHNWIYSNMNLKLSSDATESVIRNAVQALPAASSNNTNIFFDSGHGVEDEGLVTYELSIYTPSELKSDMGSSNNQYGVFLDICHAGYFSNTIDKGVISASCRADEASYCGGPNGHSVFTAYLCEGLDSKTADSNSDSKVTAEELHSYAAPRTTSYQPAMHPQISDNYSGVLNLTYLQTSSGTLSSDEDWDSNTLTGNVTVPSDITLNIKSSASVNLNSYTIKCSGSGIIINNGTVTDDKIFVKSGSYYKGFFPSSATIQSVVNWSSSGWDIHLNSGNYNESPTISKDNITIEGENRSNTTITGEVTLQNVDDCEIKNLTIGEILDINSGIGNKIYNVETGERIECDYGDDHEFDLINADHDDRYALDINNSDINIIHLNTVEDSRYGVYGHNYTYFKLEEVQPYNIDFISNKTYAVQVSGYSDADLCEIEFEDNSYDIWAATSTACEVYAECCIITGSTYGDVTINNEPCWEGFPKVIVLDEDVPVIETMESIFNDAKALFRNLREEKRIDKSSVQENITVYQTVIEKFKSIVADNFDLMLSNRSLPYIVRCYKYLKQANEAVEYLNFLINDKKYEGEIKFNSKMLLASLNVRNDEYEKAVQMYDEVLVECSFEEIRMRALYGKGVVLGDFLNEKEKAAECLKELITSYPEHPLALSAASRLDRMDIEYTIPEGAESITSEFVVNNYPNPFNPVTRVEFSLPNAVNVKIEVYNSIGQLVKTLINKHMESGLHEIEFNAKGMASGVYMYRIEAGELQDVKKMIFIK